MKICSKFTGENPCTSAWVFSLNLLHIFRTTFPRNTTDWLLLMPDLTEILSYSVLLFNTCSHYGEHKNTWITLERYQLISDNNLKMSKILCSFQVWFSLSCKPKTTFQHFRLELIWLKLKGCVIVKQNFLVWNFVLPCSHQLACYTKWDFTLLTDPKGFMILHNILQLTVKSCMI